MKEKIVNYLLSKQWFLAIVISRFSAKVDRYDVYSDTSYGDHPCSTLEIDSDKDGEWVKYSDAIDVISNCL